VVVVPVVSVLVDSVDDSVDEELDELLEESGVVVVIVVTTVLPLVVIVVTIVVVACAPNGAAPAVKAAVAAPSVISVANAPPQRANFRYLLMRVPYPGGRGATPISSLSVKPSCSTGSMYIRDQATCPSWTPKMITPRSSRAEPLRDVP
jgi:hypothetical protein